jgi:hypothetical protein
MSKQFSLDNPTDNKSNFLSAYLNSENEKIYGKRLGNFLQTSQGMLNTPMGTLIHTLIMKNLQRKAEEEEKQNRGKQRELLEKYTQGKFNEKKMLAELAAELEEKKRAAKNEEYDRREREKRAWEEGQTKIKHAHEEKLNEGKIRREIEKEEKNKLDEEEKGKRSLENKIAEEKRQTTAKRFANPVDAIDFLSNPEKYEGKIEEFDPRNPIGKAMGMLAGISFDNKNKLRIIRDEK